MRELIDTVSPLEYLRWKCHLRQCDEDDFKREWERTHRDDYYHAQTAYWLYLLRITVLNILATKPIHPDRKPEDFLLKFSTGTAPAQAPPEEEVGERQPAETRQERIDRLSNWSKSKWMRAVGLR